MNMIRIPTQWCQEFFGRRVVGNRGPWRDGVASAGHLRPELITRLLYPLDATWDQHAWDWVLLPLRHRTLAQPPPRVLDR